MKKVISLILAMVMILSLAACGEKTPPDNTKQPDTSTNDPIDTTDTDLDNNDSEDAEIENNEVEDATDDSIIVGSLNERLAYIIDNSRLDPNEIDAFPASISNETGVLDFLQIGEDQVTEYSAAFSMMSVHAYMVAVMKAAEGQDEAVTAALQSYKDSMINSFEQYLPDQYDIAKNAIVFAEQGYIGLVMCNGQDEVKKNIINYLSDIDSIKIDETLAKSVKKVLDLSGALEINTRLMNGEVVTWDELSAFEYTDIGSGVYMWSIPLGEDFEIVVTGNSLDEDPMTYNFRATDSEGAYVDMTKDDIMTIIEGDTTTTVDPDTSVSDEVDTSVDTSEMVTN